MYKFQKIHCRTASVALAARFAQSNLTHDSAANNLGLQL